MSQREKRSVGSIWRGIEVVITGLTRNRLDELEIRLAESLVFSRFLLFPLVFSLIAFTHFL